MTKTQEVLIGMFKENTGRHFLDSGDGYGRNYERNQSVDFESIPYASVSYSYGDINYTVSTYKWLEERVQFEEELNDLFLKFSEENPDSGYLQLMEEFPKYIESLVDEGNKIYGESHGIYGEGEPITINTYNHENILDQTIQFVYWSNEQGEFIALQIHGGCDVRGGYTKPQIFSVGHHSELDIFDYNRGCIYCTGKDHHPTALVMKELQEKQICIPGIASHTIDFEGHHDHYWTTDNGHHWYDNGSCGKGAGLQLKKYEVINVDADEDIEDKWQEGKLLVKDRVMYCPHCGAKLG